MIKKLCNRCKETFETKRDEVKFCGDVCRLAIKKVRERHRDVKDDTDKLIAFLEATPLKDLEGAGIFVPNWKQNGTMKDAESSILDIMEKIGGTYLYKKLRITV